jgi:hypothetical protein
LEIKDALAQWAKALAKIIEGGDVVPFARTA